MFKDLFGIHLLVQHSACPEPAAVSEIVRQAVEAETISLEDAWELLKVDVQAQPELAALILAGAREKKARRFRDTVFGISPLYVTSICQEHCTYCNFRVENTSINVTRLRLSPDQLRAEVEFLVNRHGLRVVELVYSSDPALDAQAIAGHLRITAGVLEAAGGGIVGLNAAPYSLEDYYVLRDAGLDFVVL
ncbi:MAG: hypothetical protein JXM73_00080 [Anaerolineae bacterium]|nr:hypothetical protein [Anaerolineae bacterium]